MSTRRTLDRTSILDAAGVVVREHGPDALTLRRLGAALGVDATAVYRHFRDKDELVRALADRALDGVTDALPSGRASWRRIVRELCVRLRAAQLADPRLAPLVRTGPPRRSNELAVTEILLRELRRAGLDRARAAKAYHALIGLTIGSAVLDAPVSELQERDRDATYERWRSEYADLDPLTHPSSVHHAAHLYPGDADERFTFALDLMLDAIASRGR
jgi:TetR/AcrR family transcriptional regulator, tetracycline repressor protein